MKRFIIHFAIISFLSLSCKENNQKDNIVTQNFMDSLIEMQVGQMNYYISLPTKFEIKEKEGPDFSVFYFAESDTTALTSFSGGMYFGNFPHQFPPKNDSCKIKTIDSQVLEKKLSWT